MDVKCTVFTIIIIYQLIDSDICIVFHRQVMFSDDCDWDTPKYVKDLNESVFKVST